MLDNRPPLGDRLRALAGSIAERAWAGPDGQHNADLRDYAAALSEFAEQLDREYVRLTDAGEVPTAAQAFALARFLRPALRDTTIGATVCRGGAGLPCHYLHVG